MTDFAALEHDLTHALALRSERHRRQRRRVTVAAAVALAASAMSAVAVASDIGGDLRLDPTEWSILGGGTVDDGRGAYVHAQRNDDGSRSTFMVEHDAGLAPYQAFLLHEKTVTAAKATHEAGPLCSPTQLTRAESVALTTLRAQFPASASADATKAAVDAALRDAFAGDACRGLEYAGEQARHFSAGTMPAEKLMPGVD